MKKTKQYKRTHTYRYESDVEKEKIAKETHRIVKAKKQQNRLVKMFIETKDYLDEAVLDAYETFKHTEKKERGNLKVHKRRLKTLIKEDEID